MMEPLSRLEQLKFFEGRDFRLVILLDSDVPTITLNRAIRIDLDAVGFEPQSFIVTAGSVR